ncbi:MAG: sigma-70 family RNA polymerase sigma factor [Ignavibacteria bacterium]|nr:MAG: sigma-70 family RNA polymerase sigma factor [Ignavibacteria bacterium]
MKKIPDKEIIDSVLKGHENDFALLVERYKDKAYTLLMGIVRNQMDAEEILQDSFIKAYKSLPKFRGESKFSTWFYKIVYNSALTFVNSKRKRNERATTSIDDLDYLITSNQTGDENGNNILYKLLNKLPVKYSLVLILFYQDNMSLKEIGELFDTSISNVKVTLHRARKMLREIALKEDLVEELL